ncbi:MAG: alpha/beta hydrolase [Rhizobiaceae bacterium]|nr:alpha/beta hydrolase [Rhizobiaceae bacterium]
MTLSSGHLDFNRGSLVYQTNGAGAPIVFLHGFALDMAMWVAQFRHFGRKNCAVRYDLRGFGRSSLPSGAYDHCADLAALLDHLALKRPLLVGLSLGANIALRFAAERPDRVAGIVLASPGLPGHVWTEERPPDAARAIGKARGVEAARAFWGSHPIFASLAAYPSARAEVMRMLAGYSGWHWREDDVQAPAAPIIDRLETIATPALVLSGGLDVTGYRDIADVLARRLPNARLVRYPDCGHMLTMERPDAVNAEIAAFAAKLPAA